MILEDIAKIIYSPVAALKKIIENPKYLGAIIIVLLFIGFESKYSPPKMMQIIKSITKGKIFKEYIRLKNS